MSGPSDERLDALKQRFRQRAAAESQTLETMAAELETNCDVETLRTSIRHIAHRLAGSGGTFGYAGISACASELEEFVDELPPAQELAGACRALAAEIRRRIDGSPADDASHRLGR